MYIKHRVIKTFGLLWLSSKDCCLHSLLKHMTSVMNMICNAYTNIRVIVSDVITFQVDPWAVEQQQLKAARRAKKLAKKANEKKTKSKTTTTPAPVESDEEEDDA